MTRYLLAISIGPVQEFIAAARKTADLQAGSKLLVEIAKEVALSVSAHGDLIFPTRSDAGEISDGPNKILVALNEGAVPADLAAEAETAARDLLMDRWKAVSGAIPHLDQGRAEWQVGGFLEFYSAWVPLKSDAQYPEARQVVDHLLAGRKALRDYAQPMDSPGIPKSPLDPSRECVLLLENGKVPLECRQDLRLNANEYLDAIALLKRIAGARSSDIPSTSLMAYRGWEGILERRAAQEIIALRAAIASISDARVRPDLGDVFLRESADLPPQDAGESQDAYRAQTAKWREQYAKLRRAARSAQHRANIPGVLPYYAILVADGDKMGKVIGALSAADSHRELAGVLAAFASESKAIVEGWRGHLVYAGGDDVLALLPAPTAIDCAEELQHKFRTLLAPVRELAGMDRAEGGGTLSVGIAIVHHLESLQVSLGRARGAERAAKQERNSLAVALHTRGGSPLTVTEVWPDASAEPTGLEWARWIGAFRGGLSRGFPYELRALVREWKSCYAGNAKLDRLRLEVVRVLKRKQGEEGGGVVLANLPGYSAQDPGHTLLPTLDTCERWESFASRLVIARFLADFPSANEVRRG